MTLLCRSAIDSCLVCQDPWAPAPEPSHSRTVLLPPEGQYRLIVLPRQVVHHTQGRPHIAVLWVGACG